MPCARGAQRTRQLTQHMWALLGTDWSPRNSFLLILVFSVRYFDGRNVRFVIFPVLVLDKQLKVSVDTSFD